jgi:hypothetical protein
VENGKMIKSMETFKKAPITLKTKLKANMKMMKEMEYSFIVMEAKKPGKMVKGLIDLKP